MGSFDLYIGACKWAAEQIVQLLYDECDASVETWWRNEDLSGVLQGFLDHLFDDVMTDRLKTLTTERILNVCNVLFVCHGHVLYGSSLLSLCVSCHLLSLSCLSVCLQRRRVCV